jgi:hypothetical protein
VSKKFAEWYQKTNKTEHTNKLTLLAFKIITILHNTRLATFWKLSANASLGIDRRTTIQERVTALLRSIPKEAFADSFQKLYKRCQQCVVGCNHLLKQKYKK